MPATPLRTRVRPRALRAAALVVLTAAPLGAQARWQQIGTTSVGTPVFLDTRTVKRAPDGIVTATLRVPFVKPVKSPKGPLTGSRATAKFDCRSHKVAVLENTLYLDEKANRIYEHKVVKVPGYGAVIGGSLPAIGLRHFCGA